MQLPRGRNLIFIWVATIFLIFLHLLRDNGSSIKSYPEPTIINHKSTALGVLANSTYGDFNPDESKWLDIAGLQKNNSFSWQHLRQVKDLATKQAEALFATKLIDIGSGKQLRLTGNEFGDHYRSLTQLDSMPGNAFEVIPFYQNITSNLCGEWTRTRLDRGIVNAEQAREGPSGYLNQGLEANVTGLQGNIKLSLDEQKSIEVHLNERRVRDIQAALTVEEVSGDTWLLDLAGFHFVESGSVILSTRSQKFAGIHALPHLVRSQPQFELAKQLLNKTSDQSKTGERDLKKDLLEVSSGEENDDTLTLPQCEYIIYLQQQFVWPYRTSTPQILGENPLYLDIIEQELHRPTGLSIKSVPGLRFAATIFSPDCGFILGTGNTTGVSHGSDLYLVGEKIEAVLSRLKVHTLLYSLMVMLQIVLLMRQVKEASTPSMRSRISRYSLTIMSLADSIAAILFLVLNATIPSAFLPTAAAVFVTFILFAFLSMKLMIDLTAAQASEYEAGGRRGRRVSVERSDHATELRTHSSSNARSINPIITPGGVDLLPLPVTARREADTGPTSVILPPDQDIDAMIAEDELLMPTTNAAPRTIYALTLRSGSRFLTFLCTLAIISYIASSASSAIWNLYKNTLVFCYLSFWVPQIHRNLYRNCRKALKWEFVIGESILRMTAVAYFFLYKNNVFSHQPNGYLFTFFAAWLSTQVLVLFSQEVLGPRFFLPDGLLPPVYDYHQILHEGDEENGDFMPIGFTKEVKNTTDESKQRGIWSSDCIICMNSLEAPYVLRGETSRSGIASTTAVYDILARMEYMITPCRHIFHAKCLDGWMKYKLQCPICRESLPPL